MRQGQSTVAVRAVAPSLPLYDRHSPDNYSSRVSWPNSCSLPAAASATRTPCCTCVPVDTTAVSARSCAADQQRPQLRRSAHPCTLHCCAVWTASADAGAVSSLSTESLADYAQLRPKNTHKRHRLTGCCCRLPLLLPLYPSSRTPADRRRRPCRAVVTWGHAWHRD